MRGLCQQSLVTRHVISIALVCTHAALALHAAHQHSATIDEAGHVLAGLLAWQRGDVSYYYVNPPFVRELLSLPLQGSEVKLPEDVRSPSWSLWCGLADQLSVANAPAYQQMIWRARCSAIALSILGSWLVYRWSRQVFGVRSGFVALTLWALCPNVLAWAGVCTVDLGATVFALAAMHAVRNCVREPGWLAALWAGLVLGLAQLSKFTLLVLYPVTLVTFVTVWLGERKHRSAAGTRARWRHLLVVFLVSVFVINLGYGFHGTGLALGSFAFKCDALIRRVEGVQVNRFQGTWLERLPVPLPAAYVAGLDEQKSHADAAFPAYLRGQWQERGGWWYYYLYGLGVKLPLGTLLLIGVAGAVLLFKAYRRNLVEELLVWLPALAILLLVSSQTGINGHFRYALPMFPFLFIGVSRVGLLFSGLGKRGAHGCASAVGTVVIVSALMWNVVAAARIHPHYLSYFNELAGGPDNGWKHLLESNIDWGQDLLFLKRWVDEHPEARPLHLAYYGGMDPHLIGLEYRLAPPGPKADARPQPRVPEAVGPLPGWYAISVNFVQGAGFRTYDEAGQASYSPSNAYRYFQHFTPVAKAGYSIFIYHITEEEARRVRQEMGLPTLPSDRR